MKQVKGFILISKKNYNPQVFKVKEMKEGFGRNKISLQRDYYDRYYVADKPITLPSILFVFIKMKFIYCHSCVMFVMKSMSICND